MHPSQAEDFEWDEANILELARHRITPREVVQIFENDPIWASNKRDRAGDWVMHGRTDAGRPLTIVALLKGDVLRPITGWDMSPGERTQHLRR